MGWRRGRRGRSGLRSITPLVGGLLIVFLGGWAWPAAAQDPALQQPAAPRYDVVALRVEFQPDTTRFTTGDGTFDGSLFDPSLTPNVDPLPHGEAYFEAHLQFLRDYVRQVSYGQTTLTTHLVPEVVRVSQPMAAYSPTGPDADSPEERAKLYALVEEAWTLADAQSPFDASQFDPDRTAFVLFHAGVGRDVELIGTTLDKTPQDLPSLTLNRATFATVIGDGVRFGGLPVTNTLIIPRTETRQGTDFIADRPFLLELSINGLLAASFFNYLGVPDLFDTETGETAIGPFGLMDPNGIFAFRGLFPPAPSAWTRLYLDWVEPLVLDNLQAEAARTVALDYTGRSESIVVVPISEAEYFLVENRQRDPEGNGLRLRVWQDGQVVTQTVENGDDTFDGLTSIDGFIGGVVVGVDHHDWALPGGLLRDLQGNPELDENGDVIPLNGGILIWHVDERRIREGTFNSDPERRAIALEEADSGFDIGFDAPAAFANGSPFDFWYEGNPITAITASDREVRLYENRFGPDTFPSSDTNGDGPSFLVLEDFSLPARTMQFTARQVGEAGVQPFLSIDVVAGDGRPSDAVLSAQPGSEDMRLAVRYLREAPPPGDFPAVQVWSLGDRIDLEAGIGADAVSPPLIVQSGDVVFATMAAGADAGQLWTVGEEGATESAEWVGLEGLMLGRRETRLMQASDGELYALLSGAARSVAGRLVQEGPTVRLEEESGAPEPVSLAGAGQDGVVVVGREAAAVTVSDQTWSYDPLRDAGQAVFGRDRSGLLGVIPDVEAGVLVWLLADGTTHTIRVADYGTFVGASAPPGLSRYPVLADFDGDGLLDVAVTYGEALLAFSQGGALLAGFPIQMGAAAVAQPLVAELTDSGAWSILVGALDGYLYAFDVGRGGQPVDGFPLAVGARVEVTPLLQDKKLYALPTDGGLRAWEIDAVGAIWWGQLHAGPQRTSYVELETAADPVSDAGARLLVVEETYNWPNPIRDGTTFLRCMTHADADVTVTIVDEAGRLVDKIDMTVRGGTPAEHQWQTRAPSGLYFARIRAVGSDGREDTHLVKMAVVR